MTINVSNVGNLDFDVTTCGTIFKLKEDYTVEVTANFMKKRTFGMACYNDILRMDMSFADYEEVNKYRLFHVNC